MEYGFNLALNRMDISVLSSVVQRHKAEVAKKVVNLESFLMKDGHSLSAQLIADSFFPQMSCDVFISHSSDDQDMAIQLAHELEQRGVRTFVDSVFWGSAHNLLKTVTEKHSRPFGSPDYQRQFLNRSAAHVHMILVTALQNMILRSGTLLFLHTDRSVSTKDFVQGESMTHSPWIHMELMFSHMIWRLKNKIPEPGLESFGAPPPIVHTAPVEHLKPVSGSKFMSWLKGRPHCEVDQNFNGAIANFHATLNRA